jgi:hypothetical protein
LRQIWAAKPSILRDHSRIFVPGMLVQLALFGAVFVGFGPVAKYRAGVIESERVTPASHSGPSGRAGRARRRRPASGSAAGSFVANQSDLQQY